jgi:hypothetical protein
MTIVGTLANLNAALKGLQRPFPKTHLSHSRTKRNEAFNPTNLSMRLRFRWFGPVFP